MVDNVARGIIRLAANEPEPSLWHESLGPPNKSGQATEGNEAVRMRMNASGDVMGARTLLTVLMVLVMGVAYAPAATDQKGTLVVALDSLGAQTMDPILEGRAPHAHYPLSGPGLRHVAGF